MPLPAEVGTIKYLVGDALAIAFYFPGRDLTGKTFVAHIRENANDETFVPFTIDCYLDGTTTWLILSLTGDSAIGAKDGQTRDIPLNAIWDIQVFQGSSPEATMFRGTLEGTPDVTR